MFFKGRRKIVLTFIAHHIRNLVNGTICAAHENDGLIDPQAGEKILKGHPQLLLHQAA